MEVKSEIATHEDFVTLMTDTLSQYQQVEEDTALEALEAMQIQEEDYFYQVTMP